MYTLNRRWLSAFISAALAVIMIGCGKTQGTRESEERIARSRAETAFRQRKLIPPSVQIILRRLQEHETNVRKVWDGLDSMMLFAVQQNAPTNTLSVSSLPIQQVTSEIIGVRNGTIFFLGSSSNAESELHTLLSHSRFREAQMIDLENSARTCVFLTTGAILQVYNNAEELRSEVAKYYDFAEKNPKVANLQTNRWMAAFRRSRISLIPSIDRTPATVILHFPRITAHLGYNSFEGPHLEILRVELKPTACEISRASLLRMGQLSREALGF